MRLGKEHFFRAVAGGDVDSVDSFADYAHQTIGTAYPTGRDLYRLRRETDVFFVRNPRASWLTLVHTVEWARSKRLRLSYPWAIPRCVPAAFRDGALPELDPVLRVVVDHGLESRITTALMVETDERWRRMLTYAYGDRQRIYDAWRVYRREEEDA